jgi:hypothetical protein
VPAVKLECFRCGRKFWASRRDSKWCSQRCRGRQRQEDANFEFPRHKVPRSGVPGVTFRKITRRWDVRIPEAGNSSGMKYVGTCATVEEAIRLRQEVLAC